MIKIKMSLFYLFLFLLVLPISTSITLDELINSYNYTYSSGRVDVIGAAHYGNDTNGNSLYDYLVVNISVDNLEGNYTFIGDLYRDNNLIATISDIYYLYNGGNVIQLYYDAKLLNNGPYSLSLTVQEDYLTVYRENNAYSFNFDNSLYEKPDINVGIDSYELVNNDADVKYEMLRVSTMINSTIDGTFEINALIGNGKTINSKKNYSLSIGTNNIAIDFDGREIRRERINNSKFYLITLRDGVDDSFDFSYPLVYNLYDFDAGQSIFTDYYSDGKVDLDANNLSEFLEINISLDINESGSYSIELELEDLYDNYVKKASKEFSLGMGEQIVSFKINGTDIYNSKVNGPYLLDYVRLSKSNITLDSVSEPYITNSYNYDEFERALMADLIIKSLELENETININLSNEGDGYAFGFNVEIFDDNFSSIKEGLVDYIAPGDSREVSYDYDTNTSDILKLYAIVDYDNNIEETNESNNLFAYKKNKAPTIELIPDIRVNETDIIRIEVSASDPNDDKLYYYINDSRFIQTNVTNNTFIWQTRVGDAGNYSTNITVSDGGFNVSQNVNIEIKQICIIPIDGMNLSSDTIFCEDIYYLPNGLEINNNDITLDCNNATLIGDNSSDFVVLNSKEGVTIKNCIIKRYINGLFLYKTNHSFIIDNRFENNSFAGIYLDYNSKNNTINNAITLNNLIGFVVSDSPYNIVNNVYAVNNTYGGYLYDSSQSTLKNNSFAKNTYNFIVEYASFSNNFEEDIDLSNKIDNRPIYYAQKTDNALYDALDAGYLAIVSSTNVTIRNMNLTYGLLYILNSTNTTILNNTFLNDIFGIQVQLGYRIKILNNTIAGKYRGITIKNSQNVTIVNNNIINNEEGIYISDDASIHLDFYTANISINYNNIFNNSAYNLKNWLSFTNAEYNWWGSINESIIEDKIYNLGFVDYIPYLKQPYSGNLKSYTLDLALGWNLISIPLIPNNKRVENLFTNYSKIFTYNGVWHELENNSEINETKGYWVNSLKNQTLTIEGTEFIYPINLSLIEGWNLIGYPSLNPSLVNDTLKGINHSVVYGYNLTWSSYVPNRTFNSMQTLKPGCGYWVKVG